MSQIILSALLSFLVVLLLVPQARKLAVLFRFVDKPGGRKQHHKPVPPIGGLVIFPVFIIISLIFGADIKYYWPLYAGIIALLAMGTIDDRVPVAAMTKFILQLCVASAVVVSEHARLFQLGDLFGFGDVGLRYMSIPFSVIAVVLMVNAMNLIDGLDGLAGGVGVVILFWLMVAAETGTGDHVAVMAPLAAALGGFLWHNMQSPWRKKATVFLGDAGSMALGLSLAWFSIDLAQQRDQAVVPIAVAWILALPIMDTCAQFYRRIREGRHPFSPDRGHFHHHFITAGIPVRKAVFVIVAIAFVLGGIGFGGIKAGAPQVVLTAAWIILLATHIRLSERPRYYVRLIKRLWD